MGFHYSAKQIAEWLNYSLSHRLTLTRDETAFAGEMLKHGVIRIDRGNFAPGKEIKHVLGAAPGKKRSFAKNLLHERLHVFWDEDQTMRDSFGDRWAKLSSDELAAIRQKLRNYDQKNEAQLMEEWAIIEGENSGYSIRK